MEKKNILKKYLNSKIVIKNLNSSQKVPTVRRYINSNQNYKMFQVYLNSNYLGKIEKKIKSFIKKNKSQHFIMIDFGFGLFNKNFIKELKKINLKVDLNVHSNFLNKANNFDTYKNINYLSLNQFEYEIWFNNQFQLNKKKLRLELKNKAKSITITIGKNGAIMLAKKQFIYCPVFFNQPKDTVGCGDSFFAITSVLLKNSVPNDLALFLANCYAGIHATKLGNKIVTKEELILSIKSLLG